MDIWPPKHIITGRGVFTAPMDGMLSSPWVKAASLVSKSATVLQLNMRPRSRPRFDWRQMLNDKFDTDILLADTVFDLIRLSSLEQ